MNEVDFVKNQIRNISGPKREGPLMSFILCPYHPEKTPSGRINHDPSKRGVGRFKCYGCGASKPWNELAATLGLERMSKYGFPKSGEVPVIPENRFLESLFEEKKESASMEEIDLIEFEPEINKQLGIEKKWRGFSIRFLASIGAKIAYRTDIQRYYVWLPVYVRGKLSGHILAALKKPENKAFPSYLNAPGVWSLKKGLFPFDYAVDLMKKLSLETLIIVEGPRDALRLILMGYPAVSMLGTHSWTDSKSRSLELSGVSKVVVMMDGDAAGRKATKFLTTGIREGSTEASIRPLKEFFRVKAIRLWKLEVPEDHSESAYDPGNMPTSLIKELLDPCMV